MGDKTPVQEGNTVPRHCGKRLTGWSKTFVLITALGSLGASLLARETTVAELLSRAQDAYRFGRLEQALSLASQAIQREPQNPRGFLVRGWLHQMEGNHLQAIADYDEVVKIDPSLADVYNRRGGEHFKLGHIEASIADFEKAIELDPKQEPYHWQRGISYYYDGRYEQGRDQFESHQRVNSDDVENAVWHFLCSARLAGVSQARRSILKIERDSRVPMMEIYRLFGGEGTVEEVLSAARSGEADATAKKRQLFYANLYLGLYHEVMGDEENARKRIFLAADQYTDHHYMGDVARVHAERLRCR